MVWYTYLLEVRGPYWPVWPIEWRAVGELGFLVCALIAPVSAVIPSH
ncbi:MAG TPA: hypothetical protein HA263_09145 [Methanoregulaceae archaeon]|nr:hypothetical protein [Methanoregulaceae archaeon]